MAYPESLKRMVVLQYERGKSVAEISKDSGIPRNSIYRWVRSHKTIEAENYSFTPRDFVALYKRAKKLTHMIEILRLSKCVASIPLKKRLSIMESIYNSNPDNYSVHEICEAFEVARGTFYNHIFRRADTSAKESRELQIMQKVQQIFSDSGERYGANRISRGIFFDAQKRGTISPRLLLRI